MGRPVPFIQHGTGIGRKVALIVNYDGFKLDEAVGDEYFGSVGELQARHYTTSPFMLAKLGEALGTRHGRHTSSKPCRGGEVPAPAAACRERGGMSSRRQVLRQGETGDPGGTETTRGIDGEGRSVASMYRCRARIPPEALSRA
jgi:hypothetical protein